MIYKAGEEIIKRFGVNWWFHKNFKNLLTIAVVIPYWISKGLVYDFSGYVKNSWYFKIVIFKIRFSFSYRTERQIFKQKTNHKPKEVV